jgi:hypothetical protein
LLATQREELHLLQETTLQQQELLLSHRMATEHALANRMLVLDTKPQRRPKRPPNGPGPRAADVRNSTKLNVDLRLPPLLPPGALVSPRTGSTARVSD